MTKKMVLTQIFLEPVQWCRLKALARREKSSPSAVTRQVIEAGLRALESEAGLWNRRAQILAEFRVLRDQQPEIYSGGLVNEARAKRDADNERVWRGE